MNKDKVKVLKEIYYNPRLPAAYSTAAKLYKKAKLQSPTITLKEVKDWLSGELAYTLHKPARRRFKRNKIIVQGIDEQWQADIVDLREFKNQNDGNSYILTVIDIFSKYAWAKPLKTKSSNNVVKAFENIFKERKPSLLQTDKGTEFLNNDFKNLMKKYSVNHFTSNNEEIKCAVIERFNRTLKSKMFKYFTAKGTRRYIDVLTHLINAYNETKHSTTKMKPIDVSHLNSKQVFKNTYKVNKRRNLFHKSKTLPIGTTVRQQYKLRTFDKGYYPNWSDAIYTIKQSQQKQYKPTYKLVTEKGEPIKKTFYPEQVQKVKNELFRVEKIIAQRKRNGRKEYYVKFLNHSDAYNEWIPAENVIKL